MENTLIDTLIDIIATEPDFLIMAMKYYEQGMSDEEVAEAVFLEAVGEKQADEPVHEEKYSRRAVSIFMSLPFAWFIGQDEPIAREWRDGRQDFAKANQIIERIYN